MESIVTTAVVTVAVIFPLLSTLAVLLRIKARSMKSQPLGADDWTIIISAIFCWGQAIDVYITSSMVGVNTSKLPPLETASDTLRALWISSFFFYAASTFVKISIILFYKRIFATPKFKLACSIMIVILASYGIAYSVALLFTAWPITDAWNVKANHFLIDLDAFHTSQAWASLALDIITLCFPLPVIRSLQMPLRRKIFIILIFGLGGFCCIAAAVRIYYLYAEIDLLLGSQGNYFLAFPKITTEWIWSKIEPNSSIIAACLPSYAPFFSGSHGMETILKGVQSWFSLASRSSDSTFRAGKNLSEDGYNGSMKERLTTEERIELSKNAHGKWKKLPDNNSTGSGTWDLERGTGHPKGISATRS